MERDSERKIIVWVLVIFSRRDIDDQILMNANSTKYAKESGLLLHSSTPLFNLDGCMTDR